MGTEQTPARHRRAVTVGRRSHRVSAPLVALIVADFTVIIAWLLGLVGLPSVSTDGGHWFTAMTGSLEMRAWVVCIGAWTLALILTELVAHRKFISPSSFPRRFLILGLVAIALFHLATLIHPQLPLPTPYAAVVPPLALIATIHWCWHLVLTYLRPRRLKGLLLAPASAVTPLTAHITQYERSLGIAISGVMDWDDHLPLLTTPLPAVFDEIVDAMRDCGATVLVVTVSSITSMSDLQDLRWQLENEGLQLGVIVEPTCLGVDHLEVTGAPGLALLQAMARRDTLIEAFLKRAFDLGVSSLLIVILTPLWLALIYLIRRQDGGPAFFLQERVGRNGITFPMVKFRTMVTNAEVILEELREEQRAQRATSDDKDGPDTGPLFKLKKDPRITPLGRFLRRSSVDELPQLFNVWWGHMSLVGPRPPLPREVEQYMPRVMRKFNVRPGMTGLWQVSGRSNLTWDESVRLDLHYVENRSLAFDIRILMRTFRAVLYQDGAY